MSDEFEAQSAPLEDPAAAGQKSGILATPTGRIVAIVVGLGVLGIIVGIAIAIVMFVFAGQAIDEIERQIQEQVDAQPSTEQTETPTPASAPAKEVKNAEVFTFRDVFEPLLKPLPEPSQSTTTTPSGEDTETPSVQGVLYLDDIVTEGEVLKAVLRLNGSTYTLAAGESIPGTPWQVLRVSSTQVTMLYGEVQITLAPDQYIVK
jgi:hypothetical protein